MKLRISIAAFVALTVCFAAPALADDKAAKARAQKFFAVGKIHHDAGEYEQAAAAYKRAYAEWPSPAFLFNLAQVYRLDGEFALAAEHYEKYLLAEPNGPAADEARRHLDVMKKALSKRKPPGPVEVAQPSPAQPPPTAVDSPPAEAGRGSNTKRLVSYALMGTGIAAIGTGIAFGFHARSLSDELSEVEAWTPEQLDKIDDGERAETLSVVLWSVGGAMVAGGAVLFYLSGDRTPAKESTAVVPVIGDHDIAVAISGRF